jgi:hypothetical protein
VNCLAALQSLASMSKCGGCTAITPGPRALQSLASTSKSQQATQIYSCDQAASCTAISSANERVLLVTQGASACCTAICSVSERVSIVPLAVLHIALQSLALASECGRYSARHSSVPFTAILSVSERMAGRQQGAAPGGPRVHCNL